MPSPLRTLPRRGRSLARRAVGSSGAYCLDRMHASPRASMMMHLRPITLTRRWQHALRGPTPADVDYFRSILARPERSVLANLSASSSNDGQEVEAAQELQRYNSDWTGHYAGRSQLVLRPRNTPEVSSILKYCHDNCIGVVPQGGNTGLCGGAAPMNSELILSLEDMRTIHHLDERSGIMTADAGCILQHLHEYAEQRGHLFPLDIGSKGTCQIGGNVSTNAGGQYFFRFGSLHATVMGLEVVLPADGRVLRLNMARDDGGEMGGGTHRKDNTGYDLKHLFIGAEGTLGIVTKVAIACPALPTSKNATILVCNSYQRVLEVLQAAKAELGEIISAFELMDGNTLSLVKQHGLGGDGCASHLLRDMLQSDASRPLCLLVETQGSNLEHDAAKMDAFLTQLFDKETISNGFVAQDSKQLSEMWGIREACNPSVARAGYVNKFDVSIPIEDYMAVAEEVEQELRAWPQGEFPDFTVCVWGHVADGNAHINVVTPGRHEKDGALARHIESVVYDAVLRRNGSISAEHGLGQSKNEYLRRVKEEGVLEVMASVKKLFDPRGIMNPGKYLPRSDGG
ncbi:hypothetical protein ACHAXT_012005 [Thalassiosira profunda]